MRRSITHVLQFRTHYAGRSCDCTLPSTTAYDEIDVLLAGFAIVTDERMSPLLTVIGLAQFQIVMNHHTPLDLYLRSSCKFLVCVSTKTSQRAWIVRPFWKAHVV